MMPCLVVVVVLFCGLRLWAASGPGVQGSIIFCSFPVAGAASACSAGQHAELPALLKAAWASLLKAIKVEAFAGLSQSCVSSLLLQPVAAALRNRSAALHDPAEEFWSSSGIRDALQGCDLGLVEAALAESGSQLSHLAQSGFKLDQQVGSASHVIMCSLKQP